MSKKFYFCIESDYRSGPTIESFPEDDREEEKEEIPYNAFDITFEVPKENARLFIVNEYPNYSIIFSKDLSEDDDYEKIYYKIFSQIHNCMPFEVTGYNSAYKEEGYYPDVPKNIETMPSIISEKMVDEITNGEGYYFLVIIDSEGDNNLTKLLIPIC